MEAPSASVTVEFQAVAASRRSSAEVHHCSRHQSRPGPVFGGEEGVFQPALPGKYACCSGFSFPDKVPNFSISPITLNFITRPNVDSTGTADLCNLAAAAVLRSCSDNSTVVRTEPELSHPRRTMESLMEAPNLSNPVPPTAASVPHSRLGPAVGSREGVFHLACTGKYSIRPSISSRKKVSRTQEIAHPFIHQPLEPGRTENSILEAPSPSNTVLPVPASVLHSRPGPVVSRGSGVFQPAMPGKYNDNSEHSPPDAIPNFSTVSVLSNTRSAGCTTGFSDAAPPSAAFDHRSCPNAVIRSEIRMPKSSLSGEVYTDSQRVASTNQDVTIYYQNVGGMNSNVEDYRISVSDRCYNIIALTETWLDSRTISNQVFGSEYEVFRCDRNPRNSRKSTGGGVLLAVGSELKARAIENDLWNSVEQVWAAVDLADRTLFVCVVYIPPNRARDIDFIDAHCRSIQAVLESATAIDEVIVLGDYNLPGISWQPSHSGFLYPDPERSVFHCGATMLLDSYSTSTLSQINHVVNENNRSLDLCFVSSQDVAPFISCAPAPLVKPTPHHLPLIVTVESKLLHDFDETPVAVSYDFRKADYRSISDLLSSLDWENILDHHDVEVAARTFSHILAYTIDRHVPKISHQKTAHHPWQTKELRRLKSTKRAALRKYTKYRTFQLKCYYVRLNHQFKRISRQSYSRYQQGIQRRMRSHPKSFWNYVNEQRKESGLPSSMVFNGEVGSTNQEICRLFSLKFADVFTDESLSDEYVNLAASNVPMHGDTLNGIDINDMTILRAASKLKSSCNPGPDGIPSVFLKKNIDSLLTPLCHVFQLSLRCGIFPSCWKFAHMFPVHKKGNKRDVNNYRGITSLSTVSKLFELVIMEPLLSHCKHVLSDDQHGFMSGRSTTTNLLCLTSYVTDSMVDRAQTDVIYTDLSAAFDKLNHAIAIAKLDRLGINGNLLQWFRSYVTGRQLMVAIGDYRSDTYPATSGIPQGSHLGPLIFLLYFNDVNYVLDGPRLSYADDLKIYLRIRSIADCHFLQRQLHAFADWCTLNRMEVNPAKCSVISFSRIKEPIIFNYNLLGSAIERVSHVKDLGVILDSQLTYKQHISYVVDKASRTLGFIFRITKNFTDIYCLKSLYSSLVRSVLEYCSAVWNPSYNNGVERVESVQHRFLRFALRRLPWRDPFRLPSYESRCQLIGLETLSTRRDAARALLVADTLQGRIDCPTILEKIDLNVRPRALRNSLMLRLPFRRTNYGMNGAINGLQRVFNRVASVFDFHVPRQTLRRSFTSIFSGTGNRE